jgi:hypothetical protein
MRLCHGCSRQVRNVRELSESKRRPSHRSQKSLESSSVLSACQSCAERLRAMVDPALGVLEYAMKRKDKDLRLLTNADRFGAVK